MKYDLVIVGGGPIGAIAALLFKSRYKKILLIEQRPLNKILQAKTSRTIALNAKSLTILQHFKCDSMFEQACPIEQVKVSVQGHIGGTNIRAEEYGLNHLGLVLEQHVIEQYLYQILLDNQIEVLDEAQMEALHPEDEVWQVDYKRQQEAHTIQARYLIACDGQYSKTRSSLGISYQEKDYQQNATVGILQLNQDHKNIAYEHFTPNGAVALLPMHHQQATVIWSKPSDSHNVETFTKQSLADNLKTLFKRLALFDPKVLFFTHFDLKAVISEIQAIPNALLLGNAAHSLHPIAAQGLNLSLRDLELIAQLGQQDLSFNELSQAYVKQRLQEQHAFSNYTHTMASWIGTEKIPTWCKAVGLNLLDSIPLVKRRLGRFNLGYL